MNRKKILSHAFIGASSILLLSCGGDNGGNELTNINVTDTVEAEVDTTGMSSNIVMEYSVPTPNELFEIVKAQGGEKQMNLVNPLENSENYVDQKSKAINFGVYSADVAYLSCFGIGTDFLKYFKKIEELGDELGISGAFNEDIMERIESNEGDTDSLFAISNDTYYESYSYLEENEKGTELSLIMAGGYVESLFIVSNLVTTYSDDDPIVSKIGDQRVVLESLIDFISSYMEDPSVEEVAGDLMDLQAVFEDNMEFEESDASTSNSESGTLVVSGGGSYKMSETAYNAIKAKATELRDKYTK
ncbi:MAG: hypothetical protein ACPG21_00050 [Crocinitomicaceae bacterium]